MGKRVAVIVLFLNEEDNPPKLRRLLCVVFERCKKIAVITGLEIFRKDNAHVRILSLSQNFGHLLPSQMDMVKLGVTRSISECRMSIAGIATMQC